jgi:hypothetical protein
LEGQYLPLMKWDDENLHGAGRMFGFPSYVGHDGMTAPGEHEAICTIAAVVGATLAGVDKSDQDGHDFVSMLLGYFNTAYEENVFLNKTDTTSGNTFWYELYPNLLAWQLYGLYPETEGFESRMRTTADQLVAMVDVLKSPPHGDGIPNFVYTAFRFREMEPVTNNIWLEPDAAAATAWMLLAAYQAFDDPRYLRAAEESLLFLDSLPAEKNPFYEVLLPFGALAASRLNAEHGGEFNLDRMLNWIFGPAHSRPGWGIIQDSWGGRDAHGLVGSLTDGGGYAFAMNTFDTLAAIAPIARYDERYADAIAKWIVNAANASHMFYGNGLPNELQTCEEWVEKYDPDFVLTYEGLRREWQGKQPYAMGDPLVHGWANTDLAMYGASHVGYLGGLVQQTNVEGILLIDLVATDFWGSEAYPTYLLRNPHDSPRWVALPTGDGSRRAYSLIQNGLLEGSVFKEGNLRLSPGTTEVIALIPAEGDLERKDGMVRLNGVTLDYNDGTRPMPPPDPFFRESGERLDESRVVPIRRLNEITLDGNPAKWSTFEAETITLDMGGEGGLRVGLRFGWNEESLLFLAEELSSTADRREAGSPAEYGSRYWGYDGVSLFIDIDNSNTLQETKDFNPWYGFSTETREDLYIARSHRPGPITQEMLSSSSVVAGEWNGRRAIEGAIAWDDIAAAVDPGILPPGGLKEAIAPGFRFGCEPLLIDGTSRSQVFLSGEAQPVPMGDTPYSIDLLLVE